MDTFMHVPVYKKVTMAMTHGSTFLKVFSHVHSTKIYSILIKELN